MAKLLEYGLERLYYVDNVASNLRVTPKMFGRLHRSLSWACKILDVAEPEMYVTVDPIPNASYLTATPSRSPAATSGLIDTMIDEELFFVIGHEVGHIKAGHVLYGTMARNIAALVELIGQATLGIGAWLGQGLVVALYEWFRCAELTADRAALLCVQDLEAGRDTFMKLAGGTTRLAAEMDGLRRVPYARSASSRTSIMVDARQGVQAAAHDHGPIPLPCNGPRRARALARDGLPRADVVLRPYPAVGISASPRRQRAPVTQVRAWHD